MNDLLPREAALKKIWGSDTYFNGRSMDVYIAKLRKYLKDDQKHRDRKYSWQWIQAGSAGVMC